MVRINGESGTEAIVRKHSALSNQHSAFIQEIQIFILKSKNLSMGDSRQLFNVTKYFFEQNS
jgi:hypothetical protein